MAINRPNSLRLVVSLLLFVKQVGWVLLTEAQKSIAYPGFRTSETVLFPAQLYSVYLTFFKLCATIGIPPKEVWIAKEHFRDVSSFIFGEHSQYSEAVL